MAKKSNSENNERSGRPTGPDSRDPAIEQQETQANELRARADHQTSPDTERERSNRGAAAGAFLESRGGQQGERGEVF